MELTKHWIKKIRQVDKALDRFLPKASRKPATLHQAMRYSLFAGGKRIRPLLCLTACEACGGKDAMPAAAAIECIHTYSLIHDDLPCMDNDDYRRGRLTSHKKFGEGIAVLTGDALLTLAFEILGQSEPTPRYPLKSFFLELSSAAGSCKLIAGQVADLEGEGQRASRSELRFIHKCKTAALITTSLRLGVMASNGTPKDLEALTTFGDNLGLAFQIIDDILDVTQTTEELGKSAGKDVAAEKVTYPSLLGLDAAEREAQRLTRLALNALHPLREKGDVLKELAHALLQRRK